jgi:hypothetical protein
VRRLAPRPLFGAWLRALLRSRRWLADTPVTRVVFRLRTWLLYGRKHTAPLDPLRNLWIDPSTVQTWWAIDRPAYDRIRTDYGVKGGDWDRDTKPFSEHYIYVSIQDHFVRGVPWEETTLYAVALEGIRTGKPKYRGCRTVEDLQRRTAAVDTLHAAVERGGYQSQVQLKDRGGSQVERRLRRRPRELDEVVVAIDRAGQIVLIDGIHRFAVARALAVSAIPVVVLVRHTAWQAHRDQIARYPRAFPATAFDHPDTAALRAPSGDPDRR